MTNSTQAGREVENAKKKTLSALTYVPRWIMIKGSMDVVAAWMIGTRIMMSAGFIAYTLPFGVSSPNSRIMYFGNVPSKCRNIIRTLIVNRHKIRNR